MKIHTIRKENIENFSFKYKNTFLKVNEIREIRIEKRFPTDIDRKRKGFKFLTYGGWNNSSFIIKAKTCFDFDKMEFYFVPIKEYSESESWKECKVKRVDLKKVISINNRKIEKDLTRITPYRIIQIAYIEEFNNWSFIRILKEEEHIQFKLFGENSLRKVRMIPKHTISLYKEIIPYYIEIDTTNALIYENPLFGQYLIDMWTGFYDEKLQPIYINDLMININNEIRKVEFIPPKFCLVEVEDEIPFKEITDFSDVKYDSGIEKYVSLGWKVIGNIYENCSNSFGIVKHPHIEKLKVQLEELKNYKENL